MKCENTILTIDKDGFKVKIKVIVQIVGMQHEISIVKFPKGEVLVCCPKLGALNRIESFVFRDSFELACQLAAELDKMGENHLSFDLQAFLNGHDEYSKLPITILN